MEDSRKSNKREAKVIHIDEGELKKNISEIVRQSVEDTLNSLLDAEADELCRAKRYERNSQRASTRAGHYSRNLQTTSGEVRLKVPKLRDLPFETAIIDRYRRRESSVEEAMVEMYLAGVSVRRVEDITEALWGSHISSGSVSELNKRIYARIEEWRNRPLQRCYPYVFVDGIWLKRSWGGTVENVSVLVAIGVNAEGYREILGVAEGSREDKESWKSFFRYLKDRGLEEIRLIVSDKNLGLLDVIGDFFPNSLWQRCVVHFYRDILNAVPKGKVKKVSMMLKAIHAQEDKEAARQKAAEVADKLEAEHLLKASRLIRSGAEETFSYYSFPSTHWRHIRTNNPLERLNREIRRRTRVVGSFPDGNSALMLVAARLRYHAGQKWGMERYLNMKPLEEQD